MTENIILFLSMADCLLVILLIFLVVKVLTQHIEIEGYRELVTKYINSGSSQATNLTKEVANEKDRVSKRD
jgi:hypothetical protein